MDALTHAREQSRLWASCVNFAERFPIGTTLYYKGKQECKVKDVPCVLAHEVRVWVTSKNSLLNDTTISVKELQQCPSE